MHGRISLRPGSEDLSGVPPDENAIDFRQVVDFLRQTWKLIVATALTVTLLAYVVMMALSPRYTATAQVLLEPKKQSVFGSDGILPELNLDSANVDSQVAVMRSIGLLRRVVEKHDLTSDPEFGKSDNLGLLAAIKGLIFAPAEELATKAGEDDDAVPVPVLRAIERLHDVLRVNRVALTYVISISVTSESPEKAMRLANAIADAFVVDRLDARYDAAKRASRWLSERIDSLREQVKISEEAVAKFRQEHNLTVSSEGRVAVNEQQLFELNAKLVAARSETAEKRAKYTQAQEVKDVSGNLHAIPDVVRSVVISDLRKQEAEVTRKLADAAARYSDAHPAVVNARAERRDIERSIAAEVGRIIGNLKNDFDVARAREEALQVSLRSLTGPNGDGGNIGVRLRELERVNAANKTLFESFLSRAKITQEQTTFEEREARIISPATKPNSPSFPKKPLILAVALVLGTALGLVGAVARHVLNSGFVVPKEVEDALRRPVFSSIPILSESARKVDGNVLNPVDYLVKKPLSHYAEQVRAVRVGVQMSDVDNPPKVVLVTSSVPKEGKSTLSICLALLAAGAGQRVLLIDGDLRHPTTSRHFALKGRPGLVDVLTGAATIQEAVVDVGQIFVLPAGSASQNPSDLLASARMKQILAELRAAYDFILIDSPPVAPVVDTKILQHLSDKIVYLVRWKSTPREIAVQCIEQLAPDRRLAGIVFNLVNEAKTPRYGPYSYYSSQRYRGYFQH